MKYRDSSGVLHEFELIKGKSAYDSAKMGGLPSSVTETEFYNKLANSLTEDELDEKLDEYATKEYVDNKISTEIGGALNGTY